ncbi:MAG: FG-GAP-like repeat-containing protein [Bacteroidota bacterium]|nr:FG-GAP-like repeat-containing protein [Bacteroidota bacterium]
MQQHFFVESTYQDTTTFTDIDAKLIGGFFSSVVWGDYDNDGDLDLLVNGSTDTDSMYAKIYRNDAGVFVDINAPLVGVQSAHAESWVDFDNDDDLDLIIQGATGPNNYQPITKIYRNDDGNFVDINAGLPGVVYGSTSWGDYDNDGDLDLLLTGSPNGGGSFISRVYKNNNGSFVNIYAGLPGVWGSSSAWVDYDGDGNLDISVSGYGDWGVTNVLFRNNNGVFELVDTPFALANSGAMAWGDYDNDGDLDLLYTGLLAGTGKTFTTIYRNDNGSFVDISPQLVNVMASAVAWGDYDNDGWLDILISGATKFHYGFNKMSTRDLVAALYKGNGPYITDPVTKIYHNDGGTFSEVNVQLPGLHNCAVGWGDFDNDGDLDIALTGGTSYTTQFKPYLPITKIYRNNGGTNVFAQNTKPSVPDGLKAEMQEQTIILTWNRSTDDHTPQNGIIYNLRLGTTNSGVQHFSPIANISTGYQRVPKLANAHQQSQWKIKNLPQGTYYWSVQAIDKGYAGSPFAVEHTFTITSTGEIIDGSLPNEYYLFQNYPNPFNPSTTISFTLAEQSVVTLKIYNLLGQEVATLFNNEELDDGDQSIDFVADGLSSGVYFYRLVVNNGDYQDFKKMILIR